MTMIVFDFPEIRSRMLGEDKPKPKQLDNPMLEALRTKQESIVSGRTAIGVDTARPPAAMRGDPRVVISPKAVERMTAADEWRKIVRGDWP